MASNAAADFQKILDQMSVSDVQGTETPTSELLDLNMSDSTGRRFNAAKLRNALRAGEVAGYGSLIVGRRGYPTRFAWSKVPAITAEPPAPTPAPVVVADDSSAPAQAPMPTAADGALVHTLQLRAGTTVQVTLPADLTTREAERLAHWMQALPFA